MTLPAISSLEILTALLVVRRNRAARNQARGRIHYRPSAVCRQHGGRPDALEAETRLPRKDVPIVLFDDGQGLVSKAAEHLKALGYGNVRQLDGGLQGWKHAGYELFEDVNSYAKAFGELVKHRRHTPSLPAEEVGALIADERQHPILDVRRFDEYATMSIPGRQRARRELVLRAGRAAPDPETPIIVNCAGRTRIIIGTQSLINAGSQPGGGAAQRHDRLDSCRAGSRPRRQPGAAR